MKKTVYGSIGDGIKPRIAGSIRIGLICPEHFRMGIKERGDAYDCGKNPHKLKKAGHLCRKAADSDLCGYL